MDLRDGNAPHGIPKMLSRAWHRRKKWSGKGRIRLSTLGPVALLAGVVSLAGLCIMLNRPGGASGDAAAATADRQRTQKMLSGYFAQMSVPKPLVVCKGSEWESRRRQLREKLLEITGLEPLPKRLPLDVRQSAPLDHPWCTVRRVYYQLWPGVYSSGLLFMPKQFRERPAPAMLSPHGHWDHGNAHPEVQRRCLNFARFGIRDLLPDPEPLRGPPHRPFPPDADDLEQHAGPGLSGVAARGGQEEDRRSGGLRRRIADGDARGPGRPRQGGHHRRPDLRLPRDHVPAHQPLRVQPLPRRHAADRSSRNQHPRPAGAGAVSHHGRLDEEVPEAELPHHPAALRGQRVRRPRLLQILRNPALVRPAETRAHLLVDGAMGPRAPGCQNGERARDQDLPRRNTRETHRPRARGQGIQRDHAGLRETTGLQGPADRHRGRLGRLPRQNARVAREPARRGRGLAAMGHGDILAGAVRRKPRAGARRLSERGRDRGAGDRRPHQEGGRQVAGARDARSRRQGVAPGGDRAGRHPQFGRKRIPGRPARPADLRRAVCHMPRRHQPAASLGAERDRLGPPRPGDGRDRSPRRPGRNCLTDRCRHEPCRRS